MRPTQPQIFITGVNRGLGRATAREALRRGYRVVGTVRDPGFVNRAMDDLGREGGSLSILELEGLALDRLPLDTQRALADSDILVNNLGTGADLNDPDATMATLDEDMLRQAIEINAMAAHRLMQLAVPHMRRRGWGRVVNVSSALSTLSSIIGERVGPSYRLSKLLLNGITALTAHENHDSGVLINCLCPGWCKTDMGGEDAPETPEDGARRILMLAELPDGGPTGRLFINGTEADF